MGRSARFFASGMIPKLSPDDRAAWMTQLDDVTVVHDGYIPLRDNIEYAKRYGARYIVEPGGSIRTPEIAAACDEHDISLIHTNTRLFHH
jgi:phosphoribosylaminoimidazolecarboxamide formyltransferase/IMP cyclohydrolase